MMRTWQILGLKTVLAALCAATPGSSAETSGPPSDSDRLTEIQKQLNVSYDEAEKLKVGGDTQADSDSVVPQEVERVIQGVADQMAGEIQRSLDFYTATAADSHIARLRRKLERDPKQPRHILTALAAGYRFLA